MRAQDNQTGGFDAAFGGTDLDAAGITRRQKRVRGQFWEKFRTVASHIPFADDLVAAYYCAMDPNTPLKVRGVLLGALAYFILPTDAVPDIIAGLGFTDDAAVLAAAVSMVSRYVTDKHRAAAAKALGKAPPSGSGSTTV